MVVIALLNLCGFLEIAPAIEPRLLLMQRLRQANQVVWEHPNDTFAGVIDVGNEKERDRNNNRQYQKREDPLPMRTIANQQAGADGECYH